MDLSNGENHPGISIPSKIFWIHQNFIKFEQHSLVVSKLLGGELKGFLKLTGKKIILMVRCLGSTCWWKNRAQRNTQAFANRSLLSTNLFLGRIHSYTYFKHLTVISDALFRRPSFAKVQKNKIAQSVKSMQNSSKAVIYTTQLTDLNPRQSWSGMRSKWKFNNLLFTSLRSAESPEQTKVKRSTPFRPPWWWNATAVNEKGTCLI